MTKISLYIDKGAWKRFRDQVFSRQGTVRRLSAEVEELISSEDVEKQLVSAATKFGVSLNRGVIPSWIKRGRPKMSGPSAEVILREMRASKYDGRLSRQ